MTVEEPEKPPETYVISYDANGGTGTMSVDTSEQDMPFILPECGFTPPEKKVFDAWAIGGADSEKAVAGSSYIFTADTTIYALWQDVLIETYTVTYDANGGTAVHLGESYIFIGNTTVFAVWEDVPDEPITPPVIPVEPEFKLEIDTGITDVPPALLEQEELNTPEKIEQAVRMALTQLGVTDGNTAIYDVALLVSADGGVTWTEATAETFPANGLQVTLPYPEGTDSSYIFTVAHMFTGDAFGKIPGDVEYPEVENTEQGIRFTVTGLSPISV